MVRAIAATVAAASLYSRVAGFALFAVAARLLSVPEFGMLAVAVGVSIALANTFAVGAGDQIAAQTVARPRQAWIFLLRSSLILIAVSLLSSVVAMTSTSPPVKVVGASMSICAATTICMTCMNYLRGRGQVVAGSTVAYILLPTMRTAAVTIFMPLQATSLDSVMIAVSLASLLAAVFAVLFALSYARPPKTAPVAAAPFSPRKSVLLGLAIATGWMVLSQGDVTALAVFQGSSVAGEYTPTMRVLEALTALGIGIKFAGTSQMLSDPHSGLRSRLVVPLLLAYAVSAALIFAAAPLILALTFGDSYKFNYLAALLLVPAYYLSSLVAMLLQILIARELAGRVAVWTLGVTVLAVALLAVGATAAAAVGVALANLVIFAVWFAVLLRLDARSRRTDNSV